MRTQIAAGQFYESDFAKLNLQLDSLFDQGPGSPPLENKNKNIQAAIIPHSPFNVSGKCASWAYKEIGETPTPFTYIILGPLHNKISDKILISLNDFQTPFGTIKNDRSLANNLLDSSIVVDEISHSEEHSIELQLPFLQYINKKNLDMVRILPILSSTLNLDIIKSLAKKLSQINDLILIASSDLIHHGPLYKYTPFKYNQEKELENITNNLLNSITNLDTSSFISLIKETGATICGASSILILLETLKLKNIKAGKLLDHYKSSKEENFIDFASIIYNETKN
tara:strand:- start:468 stop:1319 length:852 start_codon:yes stop_codon:yes gene_type:complete